MTPEWRLEQMLEKTFNTLNGGLPDIKMTGQYIKNVLEDIQKEDMEFFVEAQLSLKDVNSEVSKIARNYLFKVIENNI